MHPPETSTTTSTTEHRRSQTRTNPRLKIIQEQAGHDHASTTSIYTCVSSDYRTRTLRRALDATIEAALKPARRPG
jgi:integrase